MNHPLPPSAGVVLKHGSHYYFLRRSEKSRHWPLYWGFPGGKSEGSEDLFEAAKRELREETGVYIEDIDVLRKVTIHAHYIDGDKDFVLFLCGSWMGTPENLEKSIHPEDGWFTLDHLPSPILPHIREGFFRMLDGIEEIDYDGLSDIFE